MTQTEPMTAKQWGEAARLASIRGLSGAAQMYTACRFMADAEQLKNPRSKIERYLLGWKHILFAKMERDSQSNVEQLYRSFQAELPNMLVGITNTLDQKFQIQISKSRSKLRQMKISDKAAVELAQILAMAEKSMFPEWTSHVRLLCEHWRDQQKLVYDF